jgi:hypothetical protein
MERAVHDTLRTQFDVELARLRASLEHSQRLISQSAQSVEESRRLLDNFNRAFNPPSPPSV